MSIVDTIPQELATSLTSDIYAADTPRTSTPPVSPRRRSLLVSNRNSTTPSFFLSILPNRHLPLSTSAAQSGPL